LPRENSKAPKGDNRDNMAGVPMITRFKLLRAAVRSFQHAGRRTPNWDDEADKAFRATLVEGLSAAQLAEFKLAFKLIDSDNNGSIELWEVSKALKIFTSSGQGVSDDELKAMINNANPNLRGNDVLFEDDFVAMMAEAEYSAFFLEAFALLDTKGYGFVEAENLLEVLDELRVTASAEGAAKMAEIMEEFGAEGQIDYEAFVNLMMSTNRDTSPRAPGKITSGFGFSK